MLARASSRDNLNRSYNVFSLGHISPKKMVQQITTVYDNHTTTRPPAPAFDQADDGTHGWNQYYQKYYSAGHLTI
jgi:nucleolysin TIA-1/TIAR